MINKDNEIKKLFDYTDTLVLLKINEALRVFNVRNSLENYVGIQNNLGSAYLSLAKVKDKTLNCEKAIQIYEENLKLFTVKDFPMYYLITRLNLGDAYLTLAEVKDTSENLKLAYNAFQQILKEFTKTEIQEIYQIIEEKIAKCL